MRASEDIVIHAVIMYPGWLNMHTHGMEKLSLPNLQVFSSDIFIEQTQLLINSICDWAAEESKKSSGKFSFENATFQFGSQATIVFDKCDIYGEEGFRLLNQKVIKCQCCSDICTQVNTKH